MRPLPGCKPDTGGDALREHEPAIECIQILISASVHLCKWRLTTQVQQQVLHFELSGNLVNL